MVDYHYYDNTNAKLARRRWFKIVAIALISVGLIAIGLVIYDALNASTQITFTPPSTSTLGQQAERAVFNETEFRLETDPGWQKVTLIEDLPNGYRYQQLDNGNIKRDLTVYIDSVPTDSAITRVLPIEIDGSKIIPLSVSPRCETLQRDKNNKRDVVLSWAGVRFLCDPDLNADVVGTAHAEFGSSTPIKGQATSHKYFFVYRDLESVSQPEVLSRLLRGFEAK